VEPELQFQPDAAARYVMVDEVLADIRRAGSRSSVSSATNATPASDRPKSQAFQHNSYQSAPDPS